VLCLWKKRSFEAYLKENAPGISLLTVSDGDDTTRAADNMAAALQANNDIVGYSVFPVFPVQ
jgi:ribose transport system substrate-binding protein